MSNPPHLFGWDVTETVDPNADTFVAIPELAPDEQLVSSIVARDAKGVEQALGRGANAKMFVGKEKMPLFSIRHFSPDVVLLLSKAGVSYKDTSNLLSVALGTDQPAALFWLLTLPHVKKLVFSSKTDQSSPWGNDFYGLFCNTMAEGAVDCFVALRHHHPQETKKALKNLVAHHNNVGNIFCAALNKKNLAVLNEFFDDPDLNKFAKSSLRHFLSMHAHASNMDVWQTLQQVLDVSPKRIAVWNSVFPFDNVSLNHNFQTGNNLSKVQVVAKLGISEQLFRDPKSYYPTIRYAPQNTLETLVMNGASIVKNIAQTQTGRQAVLDLFCTHPNKESVLIAWCGKTDRPTIKSVLKSLLPEIAQWRDAQDNTIFHYITALNTVTKSLCDDLYSVSPQLLLAENASTDTPLSHASKEVSAQVQKRLIKKEVRTLPTPQARTPQRARRM